MMQVANYFINAQAQAVKANQTASPGKDTIVRASETKSSSGNKSFDRELSRAESGTARQETTDTPVKEVQDSLQAAAEEAGKEMTAEVVNQGKTGNTDTAEPKETAVEEKTVSTDEPVDLKAAASSAEMLIAIAGSGMIAQPQQPTVEIQPVEMVEAAHPDMAAIKAEQPIEAVTEMTAPALEALLPQDEAAVKQAAQNQELINLLQQQTPVEQKTTNKEAFVQEMNLAMKQVPETDVKAAEMPVDQVQTMQPQIVPRSEIKPEVEEKDTKTNILEGIPLTVEDRTNVIVETEAQMSGDMGKQPEEKGDQQLALTNAKTGEKIEQGDQLPGEAAFVKVEKTEAKPADTTTATAAISSDSFVQTISDVQDVNNVSADAPVTADYDIPKQIIEQAKLIRTAQDTEMVIRLKPEHLGELTLRISVGANGAVNASFHSDNAQVRGIIESTMVQLKQELQEQGLKVDNIDVRTGLSDNSFLGNQANQQPGYQQPQQQSAAVRNLRADLDAFAEDAEITAAAAVENADRAQTVGADGVDYMV